MAGRELGQLWGDWWPGLRQGGGDAAASQVQRGVCAEAWSDCLMTRAWACHPSASLSPAASPMVLALTSGPSSELLP